MNQFHEIPYTHPDHPYNLLATCDITYLFTVISNSCFNPADNYTN